MADGDIEGEAAEPVAPRDPLLLIADPVGGPTVWDGVARLLADGFLVIRESGGSPLPGGSEGNASVDRIWEDELLRRNEYPAHLVALGLAAPPAIELARRRPELVRSLVLFAPVVRPERGAIEGAAVADGVSTAFVPVVAAIDRGDGVGARTQWRSALDPGRRPTSPLDGVPVPPDAGQRRWAADWSDEGRGPGLSWGDFDFLPPVLVVDGDRGAAFLRSIADGLASRFPNATRLTLPAAGPLLPEEDPQRVAAVLFSFCLERNVPSA